MPFWSDHGIDIVIRPDGSLTIEGKPVLLENGAVEGDCIVGSLRGEGVYVPRVSIPLEMCRMGATGDRPGAAEISGRPVGQSPDAEG